MNIKRILPIPTPNRLHVKQVQYQAPRDGNKFEILGIGYDDVADGCC